MHAQGDAAKPYPGNVLPQHVATLNEAANLINGGRHEAALSHVRSLTDDAAPAAARAYLEALCLAELGQAEQALKSCEVVYRADREFVEGRHLHARIQIQLRRRELAVKELRGLVADRPDYGPGHHTLAVVLLELARPGAARRLLGQARARGTVVPDLEILESVLQKALDGPDWRQPIVHESAHYAVTSNVDRETCQLTAQVLEQAHALYESEFGAQRRRTERFRVYVFDSLPAYQSYCADTLGTAQPHTQGLYSPLLKQLLVCAAPGEAAMIATARHEGFHQYLDGAMESPPYWLNEGLAQYYEVVEQRGGRLIAGVTRQDLLRALQPGDLPALSTLFAMDRTAFYAGAETNYPASWAAVQFLRQTTHSRRQLFSQIFRELQSGREVGSRRRTSQIEELDRDFRIWVREQREAPPAAPGRSR